MKSFIYCIVIAVLFTGCAKTEEKVNVQELNQQFIGAWNNKDSEKLISLLAEDVHFLQGEAHFNGKSEVTDKWIKATIGTITDLKTNVVSSGADNQMAYEGGTFSVDVLPEGPDQPHAFGEGNFLLLWKKGTDGTWKLGYAQLEDMPVQVKN
ncbi:MAG: nuclear transport factor 2 family protein [Adhaeribacter sp.]|nr:nuclear transport factor 2 family protein [Adhaeribacter sp.]